MEKPLNLSLVFFSSNMSSRTPYAYAVSNVLRKSIDMMNYIEANDSQIIFRKGFDTFKFDTIKNNATKYTTYLAVLAGCIAYSIDITNDNLTVTVGRWGGRKKRKYKLTDEQYLEYKKMVSEFKNIYELTPKYHRIKSFSICGGSGCALKIDNHIYYQDNRCRIVSKKELEKNPRSAKLSNVPEEILPFIRYIMDLSPVPIDYSLFSS